MHVHATRHPTFKDTVQDLQLFMVVWGGLLLLGCSALHAITRLTPGQTSFDQACAPAAAAAAAGLDLGELAITSGEGWWGKCPASCMRGVGLKRAQHTCCFCVAVELWGLPSAVCFHAKCSWLRLIV